MQRRNAYALLALAITACGARTGLTTPVFDSPDAGSADDAPAGRADAPRLDAPPPVCPPGEVCDCFVEGELEWTQVGYWANDTSTLWGNGGRSIILRGSCAGVYTLSVRVVSFGSRCTVVSYDTVSDFGGLTGGRLPPQVWGSSNECAREALSETGGETCVSLSWVSGGRTGGRDLGCFAPFGPLCLGSECGGGGGMPDNSGRWTF